MSEHDQTSNDRSVLGIIAMIFLVLLILAAMAVRFKTDIRSLQQRVGELEQKR